MCTRVAPFLVVLATAGILPGQEIDGLRPASTVVESPPVARTLTPVARGDIFMARKMYREAIDSYREAPESALLANKIGIAYHHLAEMRLARRQYERAVKLKGDYAEAINNLGTVHYAARSYRRAISQYKKALGVSPNSASIYSNLGTAYFARKKYEQAFDAYQKAMSIDPDVFEHRGSQGVLLQERSIVERAKFHYYLAKSHAKAGNTERALIYMRKAIEEGFKEREKFLEEPEFSLLRKAPEFEAIVRMEARVL